MPKEYVLSVPAMWTDTAKNKTLECAVKAGFGERGNPLSIRLVSEPEAAAVYTITRVKYSADGNQEIRLTLLTAPGLHTQDR
jgi:molecular chaperone DnaK (HSP70)